MVSRRCGTISHVSRLDPGLGLYWSITPALNVRLDYGIPLIAVDDQGDSLQENGFYFSLRYQPF
jgi:hemolysin activation/secretion protein